MMPEAGFDEYEAEPFKRLSPANVISVVIAFVIFMTGSSPVRLELSI